MKIAVSEVYTSRHHPIRVQFEGTPDHHDIHHRRKLREANKRGGLNMTTVDVDLVNGARLDAIHPDLLGLVTLLIVAPFSRRCVELDFPVSNGFVKVVRDNLIRLDAPIDPALQRRKVGPDARPGLAFSGGVDSCAALSVMPKNTVPVFLRRRVPEHGAAGNYDESAALISCERVRRYGFDMRQIETTLEFIRRPVGNPVDWSNSAPAILNADALGLSSISFGSIAESVFSTGGSRFSDMRKRAVYAKWAPIFEYCNIPMSFPTASLSEVLTSKICGVSEYDFLPQSCVRGRPGEPCHNCFKCFRKGLVEAALRETAPPPVLIENAQRSREIMGKLAEVPIHHEIVLSWAMKNRHLAQDALTDGLRRKLEVVTAYGDSLNFVGKYYPAGMAYTVAPMREEVEANIARFCDPMTPQEADHFEAWNAKGFVTDPSYITGAQQLDTMLEQVG
ncbi:DUF6395 domain-containing protein [Sulfitobacter sp. F26169L]|uniref:DUF6395 domain-containing protein n=1 Tax=Sulfitobacter sp. F26169L TaxID=2996015 RepID=UPI002260C80F|nr:DUF6395 domain-containing protein [Sulfitobacter sp. F26169L]MCX7568049.1 DUF6395 domain-containing protein [Sulfitobacter sp. F26169L]